jgi:hypothetical protein
MENRGKMRSNKKIKLLIDKPYGGKTNNETLLGFEISCSLKIHEPKYHNFNKSKHDTDREDPE